MPCPAGSARAKRDPAAGCAGFTLGASQGGVHTLWGVVPLRVGEFDALALLRCTCMGAATQGAAKRGRGRPAGRQAAASVLACQSCTGVCGRKHLHICSPSPLPMFPMHQMPRFTSPSRRRPHRCPSWLALPSSSRRQRLAKRRPPPEEAPLEGSRSALQRAAAAACGHLHSPLVARQAAAAGPAARRPLPSRRLAAAAAAASRGPDPLS